MIHGGRNGHQYEASRTQGCIRLRYQAIPTLKGKWFNVTDNRRLAPGPNVYKYYQ
jgi:hypothetical protein